MERLLLYVWDLRWVCEKEEYVEIRMEKFFHFKKLGKVISFRKFLHHDHTRYLQPKLTGSFIRQHSMNVAITNPLTTSRR